MPSIYELKSRFQGLLRPLTKRLAKMGVTANFVTVFAALLSILVGIAIWLWPTRPAVLLLVPVVLFARMALNAIDGMLAREHGMKSNLGAILNELGDVVSDAALYLPFAAVAGFDARLVVGVVVVAIVGEMTGVLGSTLGASRRYDGPLGKSDRAFAFGLLALLIGCGVDLTTWLDGILWALLALSSWTVVNRARHALREAGERA